MNQRYGSPLKSQVIQLDKHTFIHPSDPAYIRKVLKYTSPGQRDFHLKLAKHWEQSGSYGKALFHYIEVIRLGLPEDAEAQMAVKRLDEKLSFSKVDVRRPSYVIKKRKGTFWMSILLIAFALGGVWFFNYY